MNLFIDTNVLLSFYHFTGDDLEELRKLVVLIEQKKLRLLIPQQVVDEFRRNRDGKIADSIKKLKEQRLNLQFPQMCKDYPEYKKLREIQEAYSATHGELIDKLARDITSRSLKADEIIELLFRQGEVIKVSDDILMRARRRMDLGNPPGKGGSLGDALNWECLLLAVPALGELVFISDDGDYSSALDEEAFNSFLSQEFETFNGAEIVYYRRLSRFFKEYFPQIKLAAELEKELLIEALRDSWNYSKTHSAVAALRRYADFTASQLNQIAEAVLGNSQVRDIVDDADVREFLLATFEGREAELEPETCTRFLDLLNPKPPFDDDYDRVPFLGHR